MIGGRDAAMRIALGLMLSRQEELLGAPFERLVPLLLHVPQEWLKSDIFFNHIGHIDLEELHACQARPPPTPRFARSETATVERQLGLWGWLRRTLTPNKAEGKVMPAGGVKRTASTPLRGPPTKKRRLDSDSANDGHFINFATSIHDEDFVEEDDRGLERKEGEELTPMKGMKRRLFQLNQ